MKIKNTHKHHIIIFSLLFLPTFSYVSLDLSSMYLGFMLSIFIIILLSNKRISSTKNTPLKFLLLLFITHFSITSFMNYDNISIKYIISFISISLIFFTSRLYEMELIKMNHESTIKLLKMFSIILIFLGLLSIIYRFDILNYGTYVKSVFPFSEPSHYVIASGWIFLAAGFYFNTKYKFILISFLISLALLFPSTLLFLLILFMTFFYFFTKIKKVILFILFLGPFYLIINTTVLNTTYFSDRLNFSKDANNLSSLVYLQGWDDAKRAIIKTNGFGVGFQNMGNLEASDLNMKIYYLAGNFKNLNDGGFLASKLISEFGIVGILFILLYLNYFVKSFLFLMKNSNNLNNLNRNSVIVVSHSIIVLFSIELFARGYGYFSPSILLIISAIYIISEKGYNEKTHIN